MKINHDFGTGKTNPNKPNFKPADSQSSFWQYQKNLYSKLNFCKVIEKPEPLPIYLYWLLFLAWIVNFVSSVHYGSEKKFVIGQQKARI